MKINWNFRIALFIVLAATALAFLPTLGADFTNWDDDVYVTNNPLIKDFSVANTIRTLTTFHRGLYKPLVLLSFGLEYKLFGLNPAAFHATNLLLHMFNCFLVMWLAMRLTRGKTAVAFVAGLFFGIHPMHVESVAWVAERKDLMYTGLFIGSLLAYLRYRETGSIKAYIGSALLLVLSLMAKPQGFMLPVALVLVDYYQQRKMDRRFIIDKLPHTAIAVGFFSLAMFSMHKADVFFKRPFTLPDNICVACYGMLSYIKRFFLPTDLSAVYPYPHKINGHLPLDFRMAPAAAVFLILLTLWLARKNRTAVFGILFFLATLAPGLQFLPIAPTVAFDHYSYLSYFGLLLIAGEVFYLLANREQTKKIAWVALCALALSMGMLSHARAQVWNSSLRFWSDELEKYPEDIIGLNNRAVAYMRLGDLNKSMTDMDHAMRIDPADGRNYLNRGMVYKSRGQDALAMADFNRAIELDQALPEAYINRGNFLAQAGNYPRAIEDYEHAIKLNGLQDGAYNNLATCFYKSGDIQNAMLAYSVAIQLNPNFVDAWFNRGEICLANGNPDCAASDMSHVLNLEPANWDALLKRGIALLQLGKKEDALDNFNAALKIRPDSPELFFNRGFLLMQSGKIPDAITDFSTALRLKKDYKDALLNRGVAFYMGKNLPAAKNDLNRAIAADTHSAQAYNNRGMVLEALGDFSGALADYGSAIKLKPAYYRAYSNRAALLYRTSGCAKAEPDLQKALSLRQDLKLPSGLEKCLPPAPRS